jgi:predicted TIM-barrel fold metal-dependent hydrolase
MRLITLEEHMTTPLHKQMAGEHVRLSDRSEYLGHDIEAELLDVGSSRIASMDAAGIRMQVLSLTTPGCQGFKGSDALALATDANDHMAAAVAAHPGRFRAFAAVPTSEVGAAATEFERRLDAGFVGAMINGHTDGVFLDDQRFWPLFEIAQARGVPVYLHPGTPHSGLMTSYFRGFEDLSRPAWGFAIDASTQFLRMLFGGVFDNFPRLQVVLGHLGEGLPFGFDRMMDHTSYVTKRRGLRRHPRVCFRENLFVTTSGAFSPAAFRCALEIMGEDNVLFSVDWPYESNQVGTRFFTALDMPETVREKLAWRNAARLLRLSDKDVQAAG